ncbi:ABC-type Na+ efflux pump, permease component [Pyrodictium delaneyi]|uniref:ABC-type Na+ efflux pump, permease component n=1 Tax=Pyrodictium delaneyi TaxID=1273541 RepID=A0A0N7JDA2_9CREN|nr:ABC transporter permease [Pyrodictium delaneyi]ALL01625.1 ABC-type Na+ efflux pump, permease component [Pyrodictium delaneyi]OWJ55139.1 hypothetical protein Pdsh_05510 [Pyrodictium delaneyi]
MPRLPLINYRLAVLVKKEALEFLRDRRSLVLMAVSAFLFPVLGLLVTGLKTQQVALVAIVVCDTGAPAEELAQQLYTAFNESPGFSAMMEHGPPCTPPSQAVATIVIPEGFSRNATSIDSPVIVELYRVVGNPAAEDAVQLAYSVMGRFSQSIAAQRVETLARLAGKQVETDYVLHPLRVVSQTVTETGQKAPPELQERAAVARFLAFSVFFILNPAAIAVADSITRERERGTGELLAITPLSGVELVLGKTLGSLTAALIAGSLDIVAVIAYAEMTAASATAGLILFHAVQVALAVMVTAAITMLVTMVVPGQRAASLTASSVTGAAVMVFFSTLFVDINTLPAWIKALLYLIPYTHTAQAIETYALGDEGMALIHTSIIAALTIVSIAAAARLYRPERLVKRG